LADVQARLAAIEAMLLQRPTITTASDSR